MKRDRGSDQNEQPKSVRVLSLVLDRLQMIFASVRSRPLAAKPRKRNIWEPEEERSVSTAERSAADLDISRKAPSSDVPSAKSASETRTLKQLLGVPLVLAAVIGISLAILADTLWWGNFILFRTPPIEEPVVVRMPSDPLRLLPAELQIDLVSPEVPLFPVQFRQNLLADPEQLCALLDNLGLETTSWDQAPFLRSRWQCVSEASTLATASVDYGRSTLFVLARGSREGEVDSLRLKLNVADPNHKDLGLENLNLVLETLESRFGILLPDRVKEAIERFSRYRVEQYGVSYQVLPEDPALTGDEEASRRLNIIMNFPEPALILDATRYVPAKS